MITVDGIMYYDIPKYEEILRVAIDKTLQKTDALLTVDSVINALKNRDMQAWFIKDNGRIIGVCITEIMITPRCRILGIIILYGKELNKWKDLLEVVMTSYAAYHNCQYIEIHGRKGWERVLKNFKKTAIVLRKEV